MTLCRLNVNLKISGKIMGGSMEGQSSLTMCTLNLNFKISGEILGSQGGSIIFDNVQTKSMVKDD